MNRLRRLFSSLPLLLVGSVVCTAPLIAFEMPAAEFMWKTSDSVSTNFYLLSGIMALLIASSIFLAFLVIRLIWGAAGVLPAPEQKKTDDDDDLDESDLRSLKVTNTKRAFVFGAVLLGNVGVCNFLTDGAIATDTRALRVMTLLRSDDGQNRADAIPDAIFLAEDERIAHALEEVISHSGPSREWAAHAAGVRKDTTTSNALLMLMKTGNPRERVAAALALSRQNNNQYIKLIPEVFPKMEGLHGDFFKALGILGKNGATEEQRPVVGNFLREQLLNKAHSKETRRVIIWAIGKFESPECLTALEELLFNPTDNATLCVGLEALGKIGSASTSPMLIETIYTMDKKARCPEVVHADFSGLEEPLNEATFIVERLVLEVARIGSRDSIEPMTKLSEDKNFSDTVRKRASDFVFQKSYRRR